MSDLQTRLALLIEQHSEKMLIDQKRVNVLDSLTIIKQALYLLRNLPSVHNSLGMAESFLLTINMPVYKSKLWLEYSNLCDKLHVPKVGKQEFGHLLRSKHFKIVHKNTGDVVISPDATSRNIASESYLPQRVSEFVAHYKLSLAIKPSEQPQISIQQ